MRVAEEYANDNQEFYDDEKDWIANYFDLKTGFIAGFKEGVKFKEKEKEGNI